MKIIATICSRRKLEDGGLLPAYKRYTGDHIKVVYDIARKSGGHLYILSGKFGLIAADTEIPYYDYYLEDSKVEELSEIVAEQFREHGVKEVDFYTESKDSWKPYFKTLQLASKKADVVLVVHQIDE